MKNSLYHFEREVAGHLCRIDNKLDQLMESLMSTFDDLKAAQASTDAAIATVKADVEALIAKLAAIPPAGMTPEQQAALDDAVAHASAINVSLSAVDGEVNPPAPVTP